MLKTQTGNRDNDSSATISFGDVLTYTFVVTNTGNTSLQNVKILDAKVGMSPLSCSPSQPSLLVPLAGMSCVANYTVTQADVDRGVISNTAILSSTTPGGIAITDESLETVPVPQTPAIQLTKSVQGYIDGDTSGDISTNDVLTYSFVIVNNGNVTLQNVTVADPLSGLSALSCLPTQGSSLAPNAIMNCTATYTVTQADFDRGEITNLATATGTAPDGSNVLDTSSNLVQTAPALPAIALVKSAVPLSGTIAVNEQITYTLVVSNVGNVTLHDIALEDPLPGLSVLACNSSLPSTLAPAQSFVCTATYTVTQADVNRGTIRNDAVVTATSPLTSTGPLTTTSGLSVTIEQNPSLVFAKRAAPQSGTLTPGQSITYTMVVTNDGNVTLSNVVITDTLPGLSPLSCSQPITLAPGASNTCTATYLVTQSDVDAGKIVNSALVSVTSPLTPTSPITETSGVTITAIQTPSIQMVKSANPNSGLINPGESISYTMVVTNDGNVTLRNVVITDSLPGLSPLSCSQPITLAPGANNTCTATYVVTQSDLDRGLIANSALVSATHPLTPTTALTTTAAVTVTPTLTPSLAFAKVAEPNNGTFALGDLITYTMVVTNDGNLTLSDVAITDTLAGLSPLNCTQPITLAPGTSNTCTATYVVAQSDIDAGKIINSALVSVTSLLTPTSPITETSRVTVTTTQTPSLQMAKIADYPSTALAVGEAITYTMVVTNDGNVTISAVEITDTLPGLSALDCTPNQPLDLAPGDNLSCSAIYTITQADVDSGKVVNVADVTGISPTGIVTGTGTTTTPPDQNPSVQIVKTAEPTGGALAVGDTITYTMVATNDGNVTLSDVEISDSLPGLSPLNCTQPITLAPGASNTCSATYVVTQSDLDAGRIFNSALVSVTSPVTPTTPITETGQVTVTAVQTPSVQMVKTAEPTGGALAVGDTITYTMVVTNDGNVTLSDVVITDTLPGLSPLICTQPITLAPGASNTCTATYIVVQSDLDAGQIVNSALVSVTSPVTPTTPITTTSGLTLTATQTPSLQMVKLADYPSTDLAVGDAITYTMVVTNDGNVTVDNVFIVDTLPGVSWPDCTPSQPLSLAPGEVLTCTSTYIITQDDVDNGKVVNVADVTGVSPTGIVTGTGTTTTPPDQKPSVKMVKTAEPNGGTLTLGQTITYTMVVTNDGNVTLSDVVITDTMSGLSALNCTQPITLSPGTSNTCTATYVVTQSDLDAGQIVNSALVSVTSPVTPTSPITTTGGVTVTATQTPSLQMVKLARLSIDRPGSGREDHLHDGGDEQWQCDGQECSHYRFVAWLVCLCLYSESTGRSVTRRSVELSSNLYHHTG